MKTNFLLLICFVLTSTFAQGPKITVTGHPDYPPIIWFSKKDNTLKGVSVELVQEMFQSKGAVVSMVPVSTWGRALEEVTQARVDLLLPPYKNEERVLTYLFSDKPFMGDRTVLFVKKGSNLKFEKFEDLKKLRGVALINDSFGDEFDNYAKKELKIQRLAKTSQILKFLLRGRADYAVAGYNAGLSVAFKEKIKDEIDIVSKDVVSTGMYFAISKKSSWATDETMKMINAFINEKITPEKIKALEEKYLEIYANE